MTVTATELLHSRTLALDGIFLKANRTFKVWEPDDPSAQLNLVDAYAAIGLPQIADIHPELPSLKAVEHGGLHEVGINIYEITWRYEGLGIEVFDLTQHNVNLHTDLIDEYRQFPNFVPNSGDMYDFSGQNPVPLDMDTDIGGFSIDVVGTPTTVPRLRETIVITEYWDSFVTTPPWYIYGIAANTRNSQRWPDPENGQAAVGTLLYVGAVSRSVRNTITAITHTFIWDPLFHLVQIPDRQEVDGRVDIELKPGGPDFPVAKNIFWRQPFPNKSDHNAISSNF